MQDNIDDFFSQIDKQLNFLETQNQNKAFGSQNKMIEKIDKTIDSLNDVTNSIDEMNDELNKMKLNPVSRHVSKDGKNVLFKQTIKQNQIKLPYTPPKGGSSF